MFGRVGVFNAFRTHDVFFSNKVYLYGFPPVFLIPQMDLIVSFSLFFR